MKWVMALTTLLLPGTAWAASDGAAEKVRQGIEYYRAGKYGAAATAFGAAGEARPDDPRILFDRACAFAAQGDAAKATELFQQAALARGADLSARCHYNLGNVAAERARKEFGENPEKAPPETREEGLRLLAQAVGHYRDCLRQDPQHADARHNLELIRLWIKHMEEIWKEQDRQQQHEGESLLEMLERLLKDQRELRAQTRRIAAEPASPARRQAVREAEESQRSLAGELEPLKDKIGETLESAPPPGAAGAAAPPRVDADRAAKVLTRLVDQAAREMSDAVDALHDNFPGDAAEPQKDTIETLDQIYMAIVPWIGLVQKAVETQQQLVGCVEPLAKADGNREGFEFGEAAWEQEFIARWSEILPAKAGNALEQLKATTPKSAPTPPVNSPNSPAPAEAEEQAEAMTKAMEKAIEVGPKVHTLSVEAAGHLEKEEAAQALPKQQEALNLLKEILDLLPQQAPQQNQDRQNEQNQSREKPSKPERPDAGEQQEKQQEPQRQQQDGQNKQNERQPPRPRQQEDVSKQNAESLIRQVRDRQRQRQQLEKELRQGRVMRIPVEKDW